MKFERNYSRWNISGTKQVSRSILVKLREGPQGRRQRRQRTVCGRSRPLPSEVLTPDGDQRLGDLTKGLTIHGQIQCNGLSTTGGIGRRHCQRDVVLLSRAKLHGRLAARPTIRKHEPNGSRRRPWQRIQNSALQLNLSTTGQMHSVGLQLASLRFGTEVSFLISHDHQLAMQIIKGFRPPRRISSYHSGCT